VSKEASRLRQRLRALEEERIRQLDLALEESPGLIRGSLGTRARVCGHPGCRCTEGQLHQSKYLSAPVEGQTRLVHVPASDEVEVAAGVQRYQRFHGVRTQISRLHTQQLQLLDELGRALLRPYPPDDPLPPAQKRGRKPKGGGATER
jgi:hypothetical protein